MSSTDIHQYAVRKRAASKAGPSRPLKKGRASTSAPTEEPDVPPASVPEPILALSAPTMLPNVLSAEEGTIGEDGAATVPSGLEQLVESF